MAIFTRFECPRCQHVFVTEGADDAFADCPKCQSMALAIGEGTSGSIQGGPPSLTSSDGGPFGERTGDGSQKGVFSQLLDATDAFGAQPDSVEGPHVPATLDDMPPTSDEGASDPFDESTVAADLPASLLRSQMMSAEDPYSDESEVYRAPTEVLRPRQQDESTAVKAVSQPGTEDLGVPFSENELDSAFDLPADDEAAWENGPPPSVPTAASSPALDEDAWEDGPPEGVPTKDAAALPRPPSTGEIPRRNPALDITRQDEGAGGLPEEFSLELHEEQPGRAVGPAERRGVWDPSFQSGELKAGAVLLSDLEAQFDGGVRLDDAAKSGDLSGTELSALEQAFAQMAGSPGSRAEDALRQASLDAAHSMLTLPSHSQLQHAAVPAPPAEGEPPPLTRRQRPAHLTLSEEAKALAGIPIQATLGAGNLALELTRGAAEKPPPKPSAPPRPGADGARAPTGPRTAPRAPDANEITDAVRPARARPAVVEPEEPGTFAVFTLGRVAAIVVVALLLGLGGGVLMAPKPEPKPTTPRTRAEQQFSQGNEYYAQGRFDDAFGSYRGAVTVDRTFAPAHRAKAAALAKLQRGEEAASAYRTYLEISPSAVDAEQVREVLRRYEGEASP